MAVFNIPQIPQVSYKWRCVADSEGPETHEFDAAGSQATMVVDVDLSDPKPPQVKLTDVIADIVGYPTIYWPTLAQRTAAGNAGSSAIGSARSSGVGGILSRKLPWQHPRFPSLWAAKIGGVQGRKFVAKKWTSVPLVSFGGALTAGGGVSLPYSEYSYYRINILFNIPPYNVLSDAQVGVDINNLVPGREWNRYVSIEADTGEENLIRPGSTLRYAKIGGTMPPGVIQTQAIAQGTVIRTPKIMYTWTWHQVPGMGLVGPNSWGIPFNLIRGIGKVNDAFWPPEADTVESAAPPWTLLFLKPKWIPENAPVDPTRMNVSGYISYVPRTYKVVMPVVYFDPDPPPGNSGDNRPWQRPGHNGVPVPGTNAFAIATSDRANNTNTEATRLYKSYQFYKLFALNYPGALGNLGGNQ